MGFLSRLLTNIPENNRLERIWLLAKTEFTKRYYGSILGLVWAFINPALKLFVYFTIFTIVFQSKTPNFILFLFLGLIIWIFFDEITKKSINLIKSKRFLLENIQINKIDIYYASILSGLLGFLFNFLIYFVFSFFFEIHLRPEALILFPLLLLNLLIFILAIQLLLSILHVFINDILHIWNLTSMTLFWFSGILYELKPDGSWKTLVIAYLSPLFGIIENARNILIYGKGINWGLFWYDYFYAVVTLLLGIYFFRKFFHRAMEII